MLTARLMNRCAVLATLLVVTSAVQAAEPKMPTDAQLIASAMRAAPARVAKDATIVAMGADGTMRTLRKGTNDFTCMPDNPSTPGPDSMCMDRNATAWINAYVGHHTPPPGKLGLIYMLEGGTDASNTDVCEKTGKRQPLDQDRAAFHDRGCGLGLLRHLSKDG